MAAKNPVHHQFTPKRFFSSPNNHLTISPFSRLLIQILLKHAGLHPNPGPSDQTPPRTIVQFNCNGIQNSRTELQDFLDKFQLKVLALQETKLTPRSKSLSFQDYTLVCKDRQVGTGGGLAFLVHQLIRFTKIDVANLIPQNDLTMELQGISVQINNSLLKIYNIYIPPASASARYTLDISRILDTDDDTLFLGDINAHNVAWQSSLDDDRGEHLADQIASSNFCILNDNSQTRHPANGNLSSPDISLILAHLALLVVWETCVVLNSDHLPISISFLDDQPPPRMARFYTNFKHAKWGLYTSETEVLFDNTPLPTSCSAGEKKFHEILLVAARHHIPAEYRNDFIPGLSRESVDITKERDRRRELDRHDPVIAELNTQLSVLIISEAKLSWQEEAASSNPRANPKKFWRIT
jgi:hypothetical protein